MLGLFAYGTFFMMKARQCIFIGTIVVERYPFAFREVLETSRYIMHVFQFEFVMNFPVRMFALFV